MPFILGLKKKSLLQADTCRPKDEIKRRLSSRNGFLRDVSCSSVIFCRLRESTSSDGRLHMAAAALCQALGFGPPVQMT